MDVSSGQFARPSAPPPPPPSPRAWVPHFVLGLSLLVTAAATAFAYRAARQEDELRFSRAIERTRISLTGRTETYTASPRNVAALFQVASGIPSRKQVHDYLDK